MAVVAKANPNDSLRTEKINGKNYLVYLVGKEDKIEKISKQFNVDQKDILLLNNTKRIKRNDTILIPMYVLDSLDAVKVTKDSSVNFAHANAQAIENLVVLTHQVLQGESLNSIGKKYKTTSGQLMKWNNLKNNKIVVGQTLIVHESGAIKPYVPLNSNLAQLPSTPIKINLVSDKMVTDSGNVLVEEQGVILHRNLPVGTLIRVINCQNNKQCLIKTTGMLTDEKYKSFIMVIDLANQQKLETTSPIIKVKVEYLLQ